MSDIQQMAPYPYLEGAQYTGYGASVAVAVAVWDQRRWDADGEPAAGKII
jgi:hypothetical protein